MAFPSLSDYKRYIEENGTNKTAVTDTSKATRQAPATYQDSAGYVKKRIAKAAEILNGKAPSDIEISTLSDMSITINTDVVEKLNITVPDDINSKATKVTGGVN